MPDPPYADLVRLRPRDDTLHASRGRTVSIETASGAPTKCSTRRALCTSWGSRAHGRSRPASASGSGTPWAVWSR